MSIISVHCSKTQYCCVMMVITFCLTSQDTILLYIIYRAPNWQVSYTIPQTSNEIQTKNKQPISVRYFRIGGGWPKLKSFTRNHTRFPPHRRSQSPTPYPLPHGRKHTLAMKLLTMKMFAGPASMVKSEVLFRLALRKQ